MAVTSSFSGWHLDKSNSRLDFYYNGTRVGDISASGLKVSGTALTSNVMADDTNLAFGTGSDHAIQNNNLAINANTATTGIIVGTPIVTAIPANSLIVGGVAGMGDFVLVSPRAGLTHSHEIFRVDESAGLIVFNEASNDWDFRIETDGVAAAFSLDAGANTLAIGVATTFNANLVLPDNTDLTFTGATGTNDIVLTNGLADALSITDGAADILVVDTSTAGNVLTATAAAAFTGYVRSSHATAASGYATGAGAAVTQITSKSTATPAITTPTGQITTHGANLATLTAVSFVVTNTSITTNDVVTVTHISGGTTGAYLVSTCNVVNGVGFNITIFNATGGGLAETLVLQYAIHKGVAA